MILRRTITALAAMGLAGLCQCSLLFGLDDLDSAKRAAADAGAAGGDSGDDARDSGEGDAGDDAPALDAADGAGGDASDAHDAALDAPASDTGTDTGADSGKDGASDAGLADATIDGMDGETGAVDAGGDASDGASTADAGDIVTGLIALYRFDETSGTTAADTSGNGNTATMVGATFATGLQGNAATLSGTNQYVSLPRGIVRGRTAFSVSAWVKLNASPVWSRIFDFGNDTTTYAFLTPNSGAGTLRYGITTAGNTMEQRVEGPVLATTTTWQHFVVTLGGATGTLYVGGVEVGQNTSMTLSPSSLGTTTQNWLGRSQFAPDPFLNGQIDNVRIYARALSAADVRLIFQQQQ